MLRRDEIAKWAGRFAVADAQIRRDHLISHILAAISGIPAGADETIAFYGGTALARTHLCEFRLSEDVDLLAAPRSLWVTRLEEVLPRAIRRHAGQATWDPAPSRVGAGAPARLVCGPVSIRIQVQTLDAEQARWPLERRPVEMRYADAAPTTLVVPTRPAFVAMKTLAWMDRHAPRDLADLAALAAQGAFDGDGARLVATMAGWRPRPELFTHLPERTRAAWQVELAHQMADPPDPDACLTAVRDAWAAVGAA